MDLRGRPRPPVPVQGQLLHVLGDEGEASGDSGAKDAKLAKRLKNELEWVRSSPKARQAKNKARLERYDQMENEARNNKKLDFSEIQIPAGPRLGSVVLEAEHLHKAFGDRVLIDDLSFTLPRNGIVGVIGPNGVGKSTLFKTIVGLEPLTSGELKIGDTVKISYVDQNREGLDPNKNLWELSPADSTSSRWPVSKCRPRLCGELRIQGLRPAEADRRALRR